MQNDDINCCFCVFFVLRNIAKYSQNACIPKKSVFRQNILGIEKFRLQTHKSKIFSIPVLWILGISKMTIFGDVTSKIVLYEN